jgi:hypothetical protein
MVMNNLLLSFIREPPFKAAFFLKIIYFDEFMFDRIRIRADINFWQRYHFASVIVSNKWQVQLNSSSILFVILNIIVCEDLIFFLVYLLFITVQVPVYIATASITTPPSI